MGPLHVAAEGQLGSVGPAWGMGGMGLEHPMSDRLEDVRVLSISLALPFHMNVFVCCQDDDSNFHIQFIAAAANLPMPRTQQLRLANDVC